MENLESRKQRLKIKSDEYLSMMDSQVDDIRTDFKKWGKFLLVTGGAMLVSYLIFGSRKSKAQKRYEKMQKENPETYYPMPPQQDSEILRIIKTQIALMLIGLARQKLMEFLSSLSNKTQRGAEEDTE